MEKCEVPCKAVSDHFDGLWTYARSKASVRLVIALFAILFSFCVVGIGGFQWKIFEKVTDIKVEISAQSRDISHLKDQVLKIHNGQ